MGRLGLILYVKICSGTVVVVAAVAFEFCIPGVKENLFIFHHLLLLFLFLHSRRLFSWMVGSPRLDPLDITISDDVRPGSRTESRGKHVGVSSCKTFYCRGREIIDSFTPGICGKRLANNIPF